MYDDAAKLIWDAQQALQRIQRFVARKDFAAYQSDELLRSAVERQFEILGEALNQLSRLDPNMAEKVPDLPRIVAFRNILIHGYASVDDRLVWGVVESRLEPLLDVVAALLSED
ncbi:MAG: HepT-like ribonuclease domain-containing protein [Sedimenticolaceae bacterium]